MFDRWFLSICSASYNLLFDFISWYSSGSSKKRYYHHESNNFNIIIICNKIKNACIALWIYLDFLYLFNLYAKYYLDINEIIQSFHEFAIWIIFVDQFNIFYKKVFNWLNKMSWKYFPHQWSIYCFLSFVIFPLILIIS
jgi:hypothetical protein